MATATTRWAAWAAWASRPQPPARHTRAAPAGAALRRVRGRVVPRRRPVGTVCPAHRLWPGLRTHRHPVALRGGPARHGVSGTPALARLEDTPPLRRSPRGPRAARCVRHTGCRPASGHVTRPRRAVPSAARKAAEGGGACSPVGRSTPWHMCDGRQLSWTHRAAGAAHPERSDHARARPWGGGRREAGSSTGREAPADAALPLTGPAARGVPVRFPSRPRPLARGPR